MPGHTGIAGPPLVNAPGGPTRLAATSIRPPITSVGIGTSSVPYGPTNGYAAANTGVTGFVGPAAGSLRQPTTWYVRVGGSNNNGGTGTTLAAERTGTDGVTTINTVTFTSASAAFTGADVGKGICVGTGTAAYRFRIAKVNSATSVDLDRQAAATLATQTWAIGGAWADIRPAVGDVAVSQNTTGAASAVNAGDTVYVGAGTYRHTTAVSAAQWGRIANQGVGINQAFPEFNGRLNIVGDVDGSKTGDAGMVQITAYTTNDKTAPSATTLLNLTGKSNIAFSNIMFVGGTAQAIVTATTVTSQNITFVYCTFATGTGGNYRFASVTNAAGTFLNWLIDKCRILNLSANGTTVTLTLTTAGSGTDYAANFVFKNSLILANSTASSAVNVLNSGTLASKGGGMTVSGCTIIGAASSAIATTATHNSIIFPLTVTGCVIVAPNATALNAGTAGQIVESYNILSAVTPRTNVTAGTGSISDGSYALLFHLGQEAQWGGLLRQFGEPMASSPLLGFGGPDPIASNPLDLAGRPRPAGLNAANSQLPAVGALERSNTPTQGTTPAPPSGTYNWKFTGPGYQDFTLPVDNTSTTVACYVQRDSSYAHAANVLPSLSVLANGSIGVSAATVYDTGSAGANNQLTLPAFTPTANGAVTIRVQSSDMTGASVVAFSVFTIT